MGSEPLGFESVVLWSVFLVGVIGFLALDLWIYNRARNKVSVAMVLTGGWALIAVAFGVCVGVLFGKQHAWEFYLGVLMEGALSIDNLVLMAVAVAASGASMLNFRRILLSGMLVALFLRGGFVFAGHSVLEQISWLPYVVGGLLCLGGLRAAFSRPVEAEAKSSADGGVSGAFFHVLEGIRRMARGGQRWLMVAGSVALIVGLELINSVLSVDSVSALLVSSDRPAIVFVSGVFGMIVLRSLAGCVVDINRVASRMRVIAGLVMAVAGVSMLL